MKKIIALLLVPSNILHANAAARHYLILRSRTMKCIWALLFCLDKITAAATAVFFKAATVYSGNYPLRSKVLPVPLPERSQIFYNFGNIPKMIKATIK